MIRDIARRAWAESPVRAVAAVLLVPPACLAGWALLAAAILAWAPS